MEENEGQPSVFVYSPSSGAQEVSTPARGGGWRVPDCSVCFNPLSSQLCVLKKCEHVFHRECAEHWFKTQRSEHLSGGCPLCRVKYTMQTLIPLQYQLECCGESAKRKTGSTAAYSAARMRIAAADEALALERARASAAEKELASLKHTVLQIEITARDAATCRDQLACELRAAETMLSDLRAQLTAHAAVDAYENNPRDETYQSLLVASNASETTALTMLARLHRHVLHLVEERDAALSQLERVKKRFTEVRSEKDFLKHELAEKTSRVQMQERQLGELRDRTRRYDKAIRELRKRSRSSGDEEVDLSTKQGNCTGAPSAINIAIDAKHSTGSKRHCRDSMADGSPDSTGLELDSRDADLSSDLCHNARAPRSVSGVVLDATGASYFGAVAKDAATLSTAEENCYQRLHSFEESFVETDLVIRTGNPPPDSASNGGTTFFSPVAMTGLRAKTASKILIRDTTRTSSQNITLHNSDIDCTSIIDSSKKIPWEGQEARSCRQGVRTIGLVEGDGDDGSVSESVGNAGDGTVAAAHQAPVSAAPNCRSPVETVARLSLFEGAAESVDTAQVAMRASPVDIHAADGGTVERNSFSGTSEKSSSLGDRLRARMLRCANDKTNALTCLFEGAFRSNAAAVSATMGIVDLQVTSVQSHSLSGQPAPWRKVKRPPMPPQNCGKVRDLREFLHPPSR